MRLVYQAVLLQMLEIDGNFPEIVVRSWRQPWRCALLNVAAGMQVSSGSVM